MLDTLNAESLAQLLSQLFQPDTAVVKQATTLLKQYFKRVQALENLLILMATSADQNVRQISCVYLRKIITSLWMNLPAEDQAKTKGLLLQRFIEEPSTLVKKNIADVIGSLGKLLIPNNEWSELFAFVFAKTQADTLTDKELAMMLLSVIIEYFSAGEINTHYANLNPIIESYLASDVSSLKRLAVVTVNNLSQSGSGSAIKVLKQYPNLIPLVLKAIDLTDEDLIKTVFETMTDFLEIKAVVKPHLPMLIEAAINISLNKDLPFNVRETTIHFLELIGDNFAKYLVKQKQLPLIQKIIDAGFKIASESTEEYGDEEESPHSLALYMLYNYACEVPNSLVYPIFKGNVLLFVAHQDDPLVRKAGLKILGHVSDSESLLDCVKDDIDELTDILVKSLQDPSQEVRESCAQVVGEFSENVVPEFLENHEKVMPCLLNVLKSQIDVATTSNEHSLTTAKAIYALSEFAANMEESEVKPYLEESIKVLVSYITGPAQKRDTRFHALEALSNVIAAAQNLINPYREDLINTLFVVLKNSDSILQEVKGQALMCAGRLFEVCGKDEKMTVAVEEFTKFALECLQQTDHKVELRQTAISYFSEICKFQKSNMASILGVVIDSTIAACESEAGVNT